MELKDEFIATRGMSQMTEVMWTIDGFKVQYQKDETKKANTVFLRNAKERTVSTLGMLRDGTFVN